LELINNASVNGIMDPSLGSDISNKRLGEEKWIAHNMLFAIEER
jgi:hypothetical protein